jgi:2-amino-4-hydroxy-6-hydroxymethyldihydropteridine diphosphokinase
MMMHNVFIGLGSNLNDPLEQLKTAYQFLSKLPETKVCRVSSVYCSPPLGPSDQPNFYNAVCQLLTDINPNDLLEECLRQEQRQHRKTERRWGERTLDIDILDYEGIVCHTPHLILPHPEFTNRLFVLRPCAEIAPHHGLSNGLTAQQTFIHLQEQMPPSLLPQRVPGYLRP